MYYVFYYLLVKLVINILFYCEVVKIRLFQP